ncbi:MAG: VWA domain-containing protein [Planctomycetes bacterium]|nr:VWA domain-containing protein [Planctomycetota bacterium]
MRTAPSLRVVVGIGILALVAAVASGCRSGGGSGPGIESPTSGGTPGGGTQPPVATGGLRIVNADLWKHTPPLPYVVTVTFSLRDGNDHAITQGVTAGHFTIYEDDKPIEITETSQFLRKAASFRLNAVLVLDYSNSMALSVGAIDKMEQSAVIFLSSLAEGHGAAIVEYHERHGGISVVSDFTTSKDTLLARFDDFRQNGRPLSGASPCWDALMTALTLFEPPSNDSRVIVFLSDGRDTSSSATVSAVVQAAKDAQVALYAIGFGTNIDETPLKTLATDTGGIFYEAPDLKTLEQTFQRIIDDLGGQYALTYVTLKNSGSVALKVGCTISGQTAVYETLFDVKDYAGDIHKGSLKLEHDGNFEGGNADIFIRADYVPRGIKEFRFRITTPYLNRMQFVVPDNSMCAGWDVTEGQSGLFRLKSPSDAAIAYGDFGIVAKLEFRGVPQEGFRLYVENDDSIYVAPNPNESKHFDFSDGLFLGVALFLENFPTLEIDDDVWSDWTPDVRVVADPDGIEPPSPPYVLRLDDQPFDDWITSLPIDLSGRTDVSIRYAVRPSTQDLPSRVLYLRYLDAVGAWKSLAVHKNTDADLQSDGYETFQVDLPSDALHANFRLDIRNAYGSTNLFWYVDDIEVIVGGN